MKPDPIRIERVPGIEQADGGRYGKGEYHRFLKREKARKERRRAKKNPECTPAYARYSGWEL